ncbi:TNT domain-containing protein [Mycobacterium alsense]|uniref:TNT domain-containing protein n=1 Tax=Mycobacterium alsense TaxID=324058 RepID=UPI001FD1C546|nr:TNT domain-containing protein [Mycobacterium alsense]
MFGLAYQDAAGSLLKAVAAAINACRQSGALIQQGAANYSRAEAASTLGGGGDALRAPPAPVKITAPGAPGTWGKGDPPPLLWAVVQSFVDDLWPDGDLAGIRAAATRWRGFAGAAGGMRSALTAAKSLLDAQQIPEGGKIDDALSQIGDCMGKIADASGKLAASLDGFADEVEGARNAIRDLLHRLGSLTDIGHDLMLIVKGDALEEIKKIAQDINGVLHHLGREARAGEQEMKLGMQAADGLVVKFEKYVRGELIQFMGDEVGNPVATVFDTWVNTNEGVLKGAVGTALALSDLDPRWFVVDPEGAAATWSDMGKSLWKGSLINGVLNPQEASRANIQMLKSLLHLDDWSTARPGLGFGENLFDAALLFAPGGGEAGAAADGAGAAARGAGAAAETAGRGARAVDGLKGLAGIRGELADLAEAGGDLTRSLDGVADNLPKVDPAFGGRPVEPPAPKPLDPPAESAPRPPDMAQGAPHAPGPAERPDAAPAPARVPHEPVAGPHEPVAAPAGGPPLAPVPAAVGERVPSTVPPLVEHSPVHVPRSPSASRADSAPIAAHPPPSAPSFTAPHFTPPAAHPPEPPAPGGWPAPGNDGALSGRPHGRSPHGWGPGDGLSHSRPADEGPNGQHGGPDGGDATGDAPDGAGVVHEPATLAKLPGVDYALPAPDALQLLEHPGAELERLAYGGVPHGILDGYEPLAGRTVDEFGREFTIRGLDGQISWDWANQAPNNGFAGVPAETTHIPNGLRLDRLGSNHGGFLSLEGVPLAERATPPGLAAQYHLFEGTGREIPPGRDWVVQHGPAKDAFGQPGGGDQWVVLDKGIGEPVPVAELILERLIQEISPQE